MRLHAAGLIAALALAGCGGDDAPRVDLPPEPQPQEPDKGTPGGQDATGGKVDLPIRDGAFLRGEMRLAVGQIVVFTNDDDEPHAVWHGDDASLPHSGAIPAGGRYEFTPLRPGRVPVYCPLHPEMRATLIVRRARW